MEHEIPTSEVSQDGRTGARRSRIERLKEEKALIERRLAGAHEKRLALERELRRAEAQARQVARKADARDTFLVGAAFLSLLGRGNAQASEMVMAITQCTAKHDRDRVWQALQLRAHPSGGREIPETRQEADQEEADMNRP